ncbi:ABC transporter substrate-binding protein [Geomonas subterranea]|uniref:ABC transporter substrate-binding protein n=1 Tax=Geomonas subterranea TaxID=2847989 RepID=A0ABX8LPG7_9BACT|nr:ABC transporter substrate-binding protein [Geomonas subterranea]QXE91410.1 ABC transporter substrate-binding protein [Geomonas subterranea]QXM10502.1 ABC transporter substrate-binding protein [Geomonas subterranea]
MRRLGTLLLAVSLALLAIGVKPDSAQAAAAIRLGYLDDPGSALVLLAEAGSLFKEEGLEVKTVRFDDSAAGLAALVAGKVDVGAFRVADTLKAIARGNRLRIIAGGGTDRTGSLLDEVDTSGRLEREERGIVVTSADLPGAPDKETLAKLVSALIKADLLLHNHPARAWSSIPSHRPREGRYFRFDPDPDYYRLADIWKRLDLQAPGMARSFLADHVYDEIYCDALHDLKEGEGESDPVLKKLADKAVCPPDCCPTGKKKSAPESNLPLP